MGDRDTGDAEQTLHPGFLGNERLTDSLLGNPKQRVGCIQFFFCGGEVYVSLSFPFWSSPSLLEHGLGKKSPLVYICVWVPGASTGVKTQTISNKLKVAANSLTFFPFKRRDLCASP